MLEIDELLRFAVDREASDLHVKTGSPPFVRIDGVLEPAPYDAASPADTERIARAIVPSALTDDLDAVHEIDFVHSVAGLGRFRVSLFRQRGSIGLVLRRVSPTIPALDELGLPPVTKELVAGSSGLVLVIGPARSGKTTTLAAMVDQINSDERKHVITIEDPVEFLHRDKQSIVSQREIGTDTASYASALRRAVRQDPDVTLVGMIDDAETAQAVVLAAAAGQLVLAAMPTLTPASTVKTLVDYFPTHLEHHARTMLAMCLRGIVSQRLLVRADSGGRALAAEILVATAPVVDAISAGAETAAFPQVIAEGDYWGMQSLDDSLLALCEAGLVSRRDVITNANEPGDIRIALERMDASPVSDASRETTLLSDHRPAESA